MAQPLSVLLCQFVVPLGLVTAVILNCSAPAQSRALVVKPSAQLPNVSFSVSTPPPAPLATGSAAPLPSDAPSIARIRSDGLDDVPSHSDGLSGVDNQSNKEESTSLVERGFGPEKGAAAEFGMIGLTTVTSVATSPRSRPITVRVGAVTSRGGLAPEVIQRVLRQRFWFFRRCYEVALKRNAKTEGTLELRLTINAHGAVTGQSVAQSSISDPKLGPCLLKELPMLAFPEPTQAPAEVWVPLAFKPAHVGAAD